MQGVLLKKANTTFEAFLTECVYDDIHGFVKLTKKEKQLINHPYFRRLHFIKQNALAHFVFPGATHTRFSHSIGVLCIIEKMIQKLKTLPSWKIDITPFDHQIIRLAALLHDVGHYPLSHTIEECFKKYDEFFLDKPTLKHVQLETGVSFEEQNSNKKFRDDFINKISAKDSKIKNLLGDFLETRGYDSKFHHEEIAKTLISNPKSPLYRYVSDILKDTYYNIYSEILPSNKVDSYLHLIGQIICGNPKYMHNEILLESDEEKNKYFILTLLLHSDLDADQMDYMLRDTKNTGIQTTIRVDFLINNMDICYLRQRDGETRPILCFNYKAFESVQQFIFSKAYWYTEIILYDKVTILNIIAQRIYLYHLVKQYEIKSLNDFYEKFLFDEDKFIQFNDQEFWEQIYRLYKDETTPKIIKIMTEILIGKLPIPKVIAIDKLPEVDKHIYMTNFVTQSKSATEKEEIYASINQNTNDKYFPIFYSNKFFKKSLGEKNDPYASRSIHILVSPCDSEDKCNKNCSKVEELLTPRKLGRNVIHKLMQKPTDFFETPTSHDKAFIEKCVVYDFNEII